MLKSHQAVGLIPLSSVIIKQVRLTLQAMLVVMCGLLTMTASADEPVAGLKKQSKAVQTKASAKSMSQKRPTEPRTARKSTKQDPPSAVIPALSAATASSQAQVIDPRIERLQEGARKAWEKVTPGGSGQAPIIDPEVEALKTSFRRPADADAPPIRTALSTLGARLFREVKLSSDHRLSCASCHDAAKSFTDGRIRGRNNTGGSQRRNTPSLWNVGFGKSFGWTGHSDSLADFTRTQVERDGEMDSTLEAVTHWLSRDQGYSAVFDDATQVRPSLTPATITDALVAYQRTLISPPTRFDRWVEGEAGALTAREQEGFRLFTGKAQCSSCHSGWRFTDDTRHDTGLRGSGGQSFKTASLREAVWSAPFMHDGRMRSLEDVIAHYAGKLDRRTSLSPELKRPILLTAAERVKLLAFLKTLSSDSMPRVR
jgi:cytochrome c peroxidase